MLVQLFFNSGRITFYSAPFKYLVENFIYIVEFLFFLCTVFSGEFEISGAHFNIILIKVSGISGLTNLKWFKKFVNPKEFKI